MPANALVQARIDSEVKEEAAAVLKEIGLTVSDAVRLLLTKVAREKRLPFEPFIPNAETIASMEEAERGGLRSVNTVEELFRELDAED
jgi:DNA-damage-inducible protein J